VDGFVFSPNVKLNRIATTDMGFEWTDHHPVQAAFEARTQA
jgi:hypothetical protein